METGYYLYDKLSYCMTYCIQANAVVFIALCLRYYACKPSDISMHSRGSLDSLTY